MQQATEEYSKFTILHKLKHHDKHSIHMLIISSKESNYYYLNYINTKIQ